MQTMTFAESMEFENPTFKRDHIKCDHQTEHHEQRVCAPKAEETPGKPNDSPKGKLSFSEPSNIQAVRLRSLSHWSHATPSRDLMAKNGWFACNVFDRVICIYCNTICQGWTQHDDPEEVHRTLAPHCPFMANLSKAEPTYTVINESLTEKFNPHHRAMAQIARRQTTYTKETWPKESLDVDELVRAGFFYSGVGNVVTCFYCNGSLHKWSGNDNPMIEHARWFPSCLYAKHLCGNELYEKIQISNKRLSTEKKMDATELGRLVSARLDLPNAVSLRTRYSSSIVKRCLEDQLRIKNDDFVSDTDFTMACLILKKQIDVIQGQAENVVVPSKKLAPREPNSIGKQSAGDCSICLTEEKQLACMPCGHVCACVQCGYALTTCPMCRQAISSFVRINF